MARGSGAGQGSRGAGQGLRGQPGVQGPARGPGWPARGSGAGPFPTRGPDLFAGHFYLTLEFKEVPEWP